MLRAQKNNLFIGILGAFLLLVSCSAPKSIFSVNAEEPTAPAKIGFENQSENADRYEWDFGDGSTSSETAPTHRYTSSGNYTITLKAFKEKRKRAKTSTQTIQVAAPEICLVEMTTPFGSMLIELYDDTPLHRDNFAKLVDDGFYDDLLFHRVINGFMVQGGDPTSKDAGPNARLGANGPGYSVPNEIELGGIHVKGAFAAARKPDSVNPQKASSGSQFYIVHGQTVTEDLLNQMEIRNNISYTPEQRKAYLEYGGYPPLDNEYTVFGRVIEGMEVIDKIAMAKTNRADRPLEDIAMKIILIK